MKECERCGAKPEGEYDLLDYCAECSADLCAAGVKGRIILDLCGGTGSWSAPYREAGYDVRLVTMPDDDVRDFARKVERAHGVLSGARVHGILAAPPCTEFAVSGARWWKDKPPETLIVALDVFDACARIIAACSPKWYAIENPIGRLRRLRPELGEPRLTFNPCDYGDPWKKRTQVWGDFTVPHSRPVKPLGQRPGQPDAHYSAVGGKSAKTKEYRSRTPAGFARAFFEANP